MEDKTKYSGIRASRMVYIGIGAVVIESVIAFITGWVPYLDVKTAGSVVGILAGLGFVDKYLRWQETQKETIEEVDVPKKTKKTQKQEKISIEDDEDEC